MRIRSILSIALACAGMACGSHAPSAPSGPFDLTVDGNEFSDWVWAEGCPITVKVFDASGKAVGTPQTSTIVNGQFSMLFTRLIMPKETYTVRYYIDKDKNGACNGDDPGFTSTLTPQTGAAELTFPPPDPSTAQSLCNFFQ